ncbi:MAG: helix-turn-helix domain containing protein [Deltaproteobacteria bacterium]|nr:helix-turn-helix domain containing protein [Deltaproteobacteria bacterium]
MGRNKQVTDEAVLKAAREAFVELGFGASTREIARRAGVSEAVLFQRHKTKLDLFFAAMIPPPIAFADERGTGRKRSATTEVEALAVQIMKYFREAMPVLMQLVMHPSFNLADLADRETRLPLHRLGEAVSACLERHRVAGAITADSRRVRTATLTLLATLHSLALFERMGLHGGSFPNTAIKNVVGLVVDGLSAEKGRGR